MAFKDTSGTIRIDAVLTDIGRKRLARGNFKVTKFALGDDEIDYELFDPERDGDMGYHPELTGSTFFEAYGDRMKNIQYGLVSYEASSGRLPLDESTGAVPEDQSHAHIEYLPVLKVNEKINMGAELKDNFYYLSVNAETTKRINSIFSGAGLTSFRFLRSDDVDKTKIIIESGIDVEVMEDGAPDGLVNALLRDKLLVKKYLLDQYFFIFADNRFIEKTLAIGTKSKCRNFPDGTAEINFESLNETPAISYENQFENYATYLVTGVANHIYNFTADWSNTHTVLPGPRGTITALNFIANGELKNSSTGTRDFRYNKFGNTDQLLFDGTHKFDYIDTTVEVLGATSNSKVQIPIRLIRYAGT